MTDIVLGLIIGLLIGVAYYVGYRKALNDLVIKMKKGEMVDTCTEYGWVNVEKNGKKGIIIL